MKQMNWNDLRFFLAVSRQGGLTGAAKALRVSQSTVSRRVEMLEQALKSGLFERHADGYCLTSVGQHMQARAEQIESQLLGLESDFSGRDNLPTGRVSLSSIETLIQYLILPHLTEFQAQYPDLMLDLSAAVHRASLPEREADIALRLSRPETGPYTVRKIGQMGFGLYASRNYLERNPLSSDETRLSGHQVLGFSKDLDFTVMAKALKSWTSDAPVLSLDTVSSHYVAAGQGMGVTVLSCLMASKNEDLIAIRPQAFHKSVDIWLVVPNDIVRSSRIRTTCDFLCDLVRREAKKLDRGDWESA
jgi:DNA-binding transcriptional LysR family regulator